MNKVIKSVLRPVVAPIRDNMYIALGHFFPKTLAGIIYKRTFNKELNWKNPRNINEKINWLKFYSDTSEWSRLADKYEVRKYICECGFEDLLVKLYGKWDNAKDIDWNSLPDKFIMKTNNGSGDVLICRNKAELNTEEATRHFDKMLHNRFGNIFAEPHYNKIKPCIIAEELLDNKKQEVESSSLVDYKIWAFNGKPAYIWTCHNRTHAPHYSVVVGIYDLDWNFHPEYAVSTPHYRLSDKAIPKPKSLDRMLEVAAKLSKGFPVLRVDLYEVDGKPYFGELTFSALAGFNDSYTDEFLNILGDLTHIDGLDRQ